MNYLNKILVNIFEVIYGYFDVQFKIFHNCCEGFLRLYGPRHQEICVEVVMAS